MCFIYLGSISMYLKNYTGVDNNNNTSQTSDGHFRHSLQRISSLSVLLAEIPGKLVGGLFSTLLRQVTKALAHYQPLLNHVGIS